MFNKLFKKRDDECKLLIFLNDTKALFNKVNKFKSVNIDIDLNDVSGLIVETNKLVKDSKAVQKCLESKGEDKKYKLQLLLLSDKFKQLDELKKVVDVYEKQLKEYKDLGEIKRNVKKTK